MTFKKYQGIDTILDQPNQNPWLGSQDIIYMKKISLGGSNV